MVILIDESGTHRQDGYSVIALVCVESLQDQAKLDRNVEDLEKSIGTTNFHWAAKGWPFRREFINGLAGLKFTVRIAQIPNPIRIDKALEEVLPHLIAERDVERIFIDGKKGKIYERSLKKLLRDKGMAVKKLRTVNDESYPGIRIADAVAGAYRYYLDSPNKEATKLYKALEPMIEFIHLQK